MFKYSWPSFAKQSFLINSIFRRLSFNFKKPHLSEVNALYRLAAHRHTLSLSAAKTNLAVQLNPALTNTTPQSVPSGPQSSAASTCPNNVIPHHVLPSYFQAPQAKTDNKQSIDSNCTAIFLNDVGERNRLIAISRNKKTPLAKLMPLTAGDSKHLNVTAVRRSKPSKKH